MTKIIVVVALAALAFVGYRLVKRREDDAEPTKPSEPPPASRENWLIGTDGSVEGKTFFLGKRTATIGRDPANFIQVQTERASRHHCRIRHDGTQVVIEDLESQNGIEVNGERVEKAVLRDGDVVAVGHEKFRFQVQDNDFWDAAMDRKAVDIGNYERTVGTDDQNLHLQIDRAMKASGGNLEVAAEALKLKPEILKKLIDRRRDGPKKWE